ncbi:MAG: hypothetical protein N839_0014565 [Desulfofustis sp. PB-SRB1]|jgi:hypothetical protein|nr:hypothetical protein [Desulfofustis sp. PB-SRB1]MBM1003617.1 hypothetical protein [Desulfofustis sp. PB-SRB1]HBH29783.1 hypothetical protein [Desulfofustis sp.]HBH32736.1 hypothetical protein [Desulfofustis sp.]
MLRTINKKFTDLASAVAFAECGEWHTAQWFLGDFEAANKSSNRKFIVLCEDIDIDQAFMSYAANLSTRLCYDIIVLHAQRRNRSNSKKSSSFNKLRAFFRRQYRGFAETIQTAGVNVHYFVAAEKAHESLKRLYHRINHVEFAIVQGSTSLEQCTDLGLPLFVYQT